MEDLYGVLQPSHGALTGHRLGAELFSQSPRNSLSFVGFLDRRGYRGADDYRRIQIGWRTRR